MRPEDIREDLIPQGRPQWIFSAYAPSKELPRQLFGGPQRELSMEEMRLRHYQATAAGNMNQAIQEADALYQEAMKQIDVALNDLSGAAKYIADGANEHPNRIDIVAGNTSANPSQAPTSGQSAFGQASTTSQPSGAFGNNSATWGNRSAPSQPSAFGQPSTAGQSSAFGQPSSLGQGSAFGQPSAVGQSSAFGRTSSLGQGSAFGQPSAVGQSSAFGQPSSLGQGSAFGQPSNMGGQGAFGKPGFGQPAFGKPAATQSPFGQPAFGQPSAPAAPFGGAAASASPFANVNQQNKPSPFAAQPAAAANPSPFGQAAPQNPAAPSPFGQPSAPSGFGQPSQNPSPFGQPQQSQPQKPSPFGQPSAPAGANPFGAAQQPAAAAPAVAPFGQPAPVQVPAVNNDVGPPVFMQIDDPNEMNPLPQLNGETRRDPSNRLLQWKGRPVNYENNYPCYLHPKDNKTLVRINFPNGAPDPSTFRQSQGKEEDYTPEITEAYQYFLKNGKFKDGIVPAVPPRKEWIGFDF